MTQQKPQVTYYLDGEQRAESIARLHEFDRLLETRRVPPRMVRYEIFVRGGLRMRGSRCGVQGDRLIVGGYTHNENGRPHGYVARDLPLADVQRVVLHQPAYAARRTYEIFALVYPHRSATAAQDRAEKIIRGCNVYFTREARRGVDREIFGPDLFADWTMTYQEALHWIGFETFADWVTLTVTYSVQYDRQRARVPETAYHPPALSALLRITGGGETAP